MHFPELIFKFWIFYFVYTATVWYVLHASIWLSSWSWALGLEIYRKIKNSKLKLKLKFMKFAFLLFIFYSYITMHGTKT